MAIPNDTIMPVPKMMTIGGDGGKTLTPNDTIMPVTSVTDKSVQPVNTQASARPVPQISSTPTIDNVAQSSTVTANAAQSAPTDLVENRVGNIINTNSPLMQLAAARANQTANSRGLLNSSMAVGEGQKAVMDAATPIASADSAALNQNSQYNASNQQQVNLQNATQAQRTGELNAASTNQATATNIDNQLKTLLANADTSTKAYLTQLDDEMKTKIQSSANMATLFNAYTQQAAAILTSDKLDKAGKESALAGLQAMLKDSVATQDAITGLDISGTVLGADSAAATNSAVQTQVGDLNTQLASLKQQLANLQNQNSYSGIGGFSNNA